MILLTGGTGFLGRFIVDELLTHGHQVRLLARSPEKVQAREGVEIVEGDLRDQLALERAMDGVTHVIHAAAMVSFWSRKRDEMFEINAKGTALLVDLALEANVEKFVQISSVSALGRRKNSGPIDESAKWIKSKLNTNYGRSKYLAELEVLRGVQEGLNAVMCNPGIIIGPGDWDQGPPKMFKMIHKGLRYYNPGITGFVPAVDVARATRLLMGSEFVNGERFVLVSDSIPYKDFFAKVAESVNGKAPSVAPPAFLAKLVGRISVWMAAMRGKEPLITPETARVSRYQFHYDGSKITKELDFSYGSLEAVIKETGAQFLKEHGA